MEKLIILSRGQAACVAVSIILIIIVAVAIIFIVLYLSHPRLHIQHLSIPSLVVPNLNKTTTFNTSVLVDLKFERAAALKRKCYEDFQMTLLYGQNRSKSFQVGTRMVQGFNMGWKRRVHVKAAVEAVGIPRQEAFQAVSGGNVVAMEVELMMSLKSDANRFVARVAVDASGHMVSKNPIKFT